ncbi:MAG: hypothetical protein JNM19_00015 [Chitinophagaceae bacterium]|nr:hypothetical protein [Chitinophagaceae bacterium]
MRSICLVSLFLVLLQRTAAQELYVYAEPASNIPARALSVKLTEHFVVSDNIYQRFSNRLMPQVMYGINKKLMIGTSVTFSNMHTTDYKYESARLYAKYRFLSNDGLHKHFRMAFFADASTTQAPFHYDEITLMGDKSGIEAGVIATQLWHKLALSTTISHSQVLDQSRKNKGVIYIPTRAYQAMNYSLSAGYLLFPREYKDYKQVNLNLYLEVMAQQTLDKKANYLDLAPAFQLIFNSNTKLNIGYRFQAAGNMQRMSSNSWQVSLERTFLNAFSRNK